MNPLGSRNVLSQPAFSDRYENTAKVVLGELLSSQLLEPEVGWGDWKGSDSWWNGCRRICNVHFAPWRCCTLPVVFSCLELLVSWFAWKPLLVNRLVDLRIQNIWNSSVLHTQTGEFACQSSNGPWSKARLARFQPRPLFTRIFDEYADEHSVRGLSTPFVIGESASQQSCHDWFTVSALLHQLLVIVCMCTVYKFMKSSGKLQYALATCKSLDTLFGGDTV